ncbi:hypothetical protein DX933_03730 [Ornithinibacillus gellani]|uniref:BsuPI-related putative proteinase inhibitor n=1 Tax=Ornithinibacillus gellani TaxID=2293253 RepID=UPI000F48DE4A|nr:BsuPI-related putative proteinase inhibitor [Ornithinibacillus gellani]TQS75945.1 hypothetical protein DX933_03730 [Ornithinibacillus gellani]
MKKTIFGIVAIVIIGIVLAFVIMNNQKSDDDNNKDQTDDGGGELKDKDDMKDPFDPGDGDDVDTEGVEFTLVPADMQSAEKTFNYTVKNNSEDSVVFQFGSSQKYEFIITNEAGEEVHRYSKGRAFMQVIQEMELKPGDEETFELELPELEKGTYTITVFLAAKGFSEKTISKEFTIE